MEVVQYIGGCSVHRGDNISTVGGQLQYCGGCSVQWGIASVLWGDSFSIVEVVQYSGGIPSVHVGGYHQYMRGDNISTVGDNISTVEDIQYCGGIPSVLWGDSFSTVGG